MWILRVSYTTDGVIGAKHRNSWKEVQHNEKAIFQAGKKEVPKIYKSGWKGAFAPGWGGSVILSKPLCLVQNKMYQKDSRVAPGSFCWIWPPLLEIAMIKVECLRENVADSMLPLWWQSLEKNLSLSVSSECLSYYKPKYRAEHLFCDFLLPWVWSRWWVS